jgi:uroporphyrinogen-III synthase
LTIALPETRELDRLAAILEADGAATFRCPLVAILDAPDPAPVDAWLRRLVAGGFDDLVFLTGEGLRRLLSRADVLGLRTEVLAALAKTRKITRGPKPARALHEVKLSTDLPAPTPTSQGVMEALGGESLAGHRVGLQLYGTEPNEPLVRFLEGAGAQVFTVAPYVYAPAADEDRVVELIGRLDAGTVDVIAFTSAAQVDRLWNVAQERKLEATLKGALGRTKVAAIGPIAVEALEDRGARVDIVPEQPFVMKRLTAAIRAAFAR